jgi:hypothetical protein
MKPLKKNLYELPQKMSSKTFLHSQIILEAPKEKLKRRQNPKLKWQE